LWGSSDGVQRWGTNVVGSIVTDPVYGNLLRVPYNAGVSGNECHLSVCNSSGAVFAFNTNNNSWELAGINRAGRVNLFCAKQVPRLQDFEDVILVLLHGENLGGLVYRNPFAS
jgi:hypothetical protein